MNPIPLTPDQVKQIIDAYKLTQDDNSEIKLIIALVTVGILVLGGIFAVLKLSFTVGRFISKVDLKLEHVEKVVPMVAEHDSEIRELKIHRENHEQSIGRLIKIRGGA